MSLLFPVDDNGNPISVLGFDYRGTQTINVTTTNSAVSAPIPDDIEIVTIISTDACRFEIGDATVDAVRGSSPVLYPGTYIDVPLRSGERHIAFIAEQADCVAYVIGRI
ncbi:MAG: hypothetical protein AAFY56_22425 [Pseudomonadota bacterium]